MLTGSSQVPMGVRFAAPVHGAAEGEGSDTKGYQAMWRAELDPAAKKCAYNTTTESVLTDCGVTLNTCVCCAYRPTPSQIITSNRQQPSRNRISGSQ